MSRKMTQVGVAWKKKTQEGGKEFLSVVLTNPVGPDIRLSIWPNGFKEKDGQPDFMIYKSADQRPVAQTAASAFPAAEARPDDGAASEFPTDDNPREGDDEVPF